MKLAFVLNIASRTYNVQVHDIVRTVDLDCDGYVSWEEFKHAFFEPSESPGFCRIFLMADDCVVALCACVRQVIVRRKRRGGVLLRKYVGTGDTTHHPPMVPFC